MNSSTTPDTQEAAHLEKLRTQLSTDIEAMHQKEASLKEYEQRLRLLVEHTQHSPPPQNASQFYVTTGPSQANSILEWHSILQAGGRFLRSPTRQPVTQAGKFRRCNRGFLFD